MTIKPQKVKDVSWEHVKYPCYLQPKYNGLFGQYNNGEFHTRELKRWKHVVIAHALKDLAHIPSHIILFGEWYHHGWMLQEINSHIGVNNLEPDDKTAEISFCVFDCLDTARPTLKFSDRLLLLSNLCLEHTFERVLTTEVYTREDIDSAFNFYVNSLNYEGVIIRNPSAIYKPDSRNYDVMRYKLWKDLDATVVALERGKSKTLFARHQNSLGALVVRTDDGKEFGVGSGLTDAQRDEFWKSPEKIMGRRVKVKFELFSKDGIPVKPTLICIT